jgi:hypothetical protein
MAYRKENRPENHGRKDGVYRPKEQSDRRPESSHSD